MVFIKRKKQKKYGIHSVQRDEIPKIQDFFSNNYWVK